MLFKFSKNRFFERYTGLNFSSHIQLIDDEIHQENLYRVSHSEFWMDTHVYILSATTFDNFQIFALKDAWGLGILLKISKLVIQMADIHLGVECTHF